MACCLVASKSRPLKATSWSLGRCFDGQSRSRDAVCARQPEDVRIVVPSRIGRRDWLEKERIAGVLEAAPNDDLLFILFSGFDAGLRRNEIVEARVSWFDLRNGLLHVRKSAAFEPKDKEERTIPLIFPRGDFRTEIAILYYI